LRQILVERELVPDGWIAWGAVPTDQPIGESASPEDCPEVGF